MELAHFSIALERAPAVWAAQDFWAFAAASMAEFVSSAEMHGTSVITFSVAGFTT